MENGVPIYRQNSSDYTAEPVIWHYGFPVPASLVDQMQTFGGKIVCPAVDGSGVTAYNPGSVDAEIGGASTAGLGDSQPQEAQQAFDADVSGGVVNESAAADAHPAAAGGEPPPPAYGPRSRKEIDLRAEAVSTKHLLRHKPFNPHCVDCCRSKMAQKRHMAGSYNREPKKWGEIITADHLVSSKKGRKHGVRGWRNAVNLKDLWSGLISCVPVKDKGSEEARRAFKLFCGARKIQRIFSDNAGELKAAAEKLKVPHELSEAGVPVSNCIAERNNQNIIMMAKPALCRAGLPACCWPFAAPHACFMDNTHYEDGDESPWNKTHKKGEFTGLKIPFGARVLFKPSDTRPGDVPGKWEPDGVDGIFAGYDMTPGYHWSKRYLVWSLTDFDGLALKKNIIAEEFNVHEPFSVARLRVVPGPWDFP